MSAGECTLPCKRMNRHYMPSPMDQFVWVYASLYLVNVQFIYHLLHTECFSINWIRSFFCESIFRISWSLYREIGYLQIQNIFIVTKRVPENCAKRCTFTLYIRRERERILTNWTNTGSKKHWVSLFPYKWQLLLSSLFTDVHQRGGLDLVLTLYF